MHNFKNNNLVLGKCQLSTHMASFTLFLSISTPSVYACFLLDRGTSKQWCLVYTANSDHIILYRTFPVL